MALNYFKMSSKQDRTLLFFACKSRDPGLSCQKNLTKIRQKITSQSIPQCHRINLVDSYIMGLLYKQIERMNILPV